MRFGGPTEPTDPREGLTRWRYGAFCEAGTPRSVGMALVVVAVVSLVVEVFFYSATRLWIATDSGTYIQLAAGLAERLDFTQPNFEFRTPGYPMFLAVVFRLFGTASADVILFLQHMMIAVAAILSAMTAAALRPRVSIVLLVGLLAVVDLHLRAYAATVLTEVPYALAITACVYALVRYYATPRARWIILASTAGGVCALIKGLGVVMPVLCVGVAGYSAWLAARGERFSTRFRRVSFALPLAIVPAALMILPVLANSYRSTGYFQLSYQLPMVLYYRAVSVEGFDSSTSPAMTELREAFDEGRRAGRIRPGETMRDIFRVADAHRFKHGGTRTDSARMMGEAALDMLLEHKLLLVRHGLFYSYQTLFIPDPYYRVVPGACPMDIFDTAAAAEDMSRFVGKSTLERYLPLGKVRHIASQPTRTSPIMDKIARWYHRDVDTGSSVLGIVDSPYEAMILLCVLGGAATVFRQDRFHWLIVGFPIVLHVVLSSNLGGASARYAIPTHPLLVIFGAFALYGVGRGFVLGGQMLRAHRAGSSRQSESSVLNPRPT